MQLKRFHFAVRANYGYLSLKKEPGETLTERAMRRSMDCAEPHVEVHMLNRLRAQNDSVTLLKASRILLEFPSKRLLLRYIEGFTSDEALETDIMTHFKFVRYQKEFVLFLRNLVKSDAERGHLMRNLEVFVRNLDAGLSGWFASAVERGADELSEMLDRKLSSSDSGTEEQILGLEILKINECVMRYNGQAAVIFQAMRELREKSKNVILSQQRASRRLMQVQLLNSRRYGASVTTDFITTDERHNWLSRYSAALKAPEGTELEKENKYEEIRNVCSEFLSVATADALTILSEHFLSPSSKIVPIGGEYPVYSSRNIKIMRPAMEKFDDIAVGISEAQYATTQGGEKHYTYDLHNISYSIVEDHDGIFNGSDDYAMKAAGNDRKASLEFAKVRVTRIQVPLTATIDYFGFRVLAVSKLPSERVIFTPEGDVRRVIEEQVYGLQSNGDHFLNKSNDLQSILEGASRQLNLAKHHCYGAKDITSGAVTPPTFISSETAVYRDQDVCDEEGFTSPKKGGDIYYMKNFWRSFPPELPEGTPHLNRVPRDQSVFWRLLRPELVRNNRVALNPDAECLVSQRVRGS